MCHVVAVKFLQLCTIRTPVNYETLFLMSPVVDRRDGILSTVGLRVHVRRPPLQVWARPPGSLTCPRPRRST